MILVTQECEKAIDTQYLYLYYIEYERNIDEDDPDAWIWKVMASYTNDRAIDVELGFFDSSIKAAIVLSSIAEAIANGSNIYYVPTEELVDIEKFINSEEAKS